MSNDGQFIIGPSIRPNRNESLVNKLTTNIRSISFDAASLTSVLDSICLQYAYRFVNCYVDLYHK